MDEQHLFTLYVHLPPNKTLEGPATIFNGREIPGSIQTGETAFGARRLELYEGCLLPERSLALI